MGSGHGALRAEGAPRTVTSPAPQERARGAVYPTPLGALSFARAAGCGMSADMPRDPSKRFPVRFLPSVGLWEVDVRPHGRIRSVLFPRAREPVKLVSREMADEIRRTILADIERGVEETAAVAPYLPRESLLGSWAARWLKSIEKAVESGEKSPTYLRRLRFFAGPDGDWAPLFGTHIHALDLVQLEDFADDLRASGKSPTTVAHALQSLRTCIRWAARRSGGAFGVPDFPEVRRVDHEPVELSPEEQNAVLAEISVPKRGLFLALTDLMVRPGEARAGDVDDYDFDSRELRVHHALKGYEADAPRLGTKGRDRRLIVVTQRVSDWLEEHVPLRARVERSVPLFQAPDGARWSHPQLMGLWRRARDRAGVKYCSLYEGTKHSTATWLRRQGLSLDEIGLALGHAHARRGQEVTERYARPPRVANATIAKILDARVQRPTV